VPTPPLTWVELLGRYSRWTYWKKNAERILGHTLQDGRKAGRPLRQLVRKLANEEVSRLVEAYQAGATVYELAEEFKIHRTTVSLHLERAGVTMRRLGLSEEQIAAAILLYQQGWSLARLGDKFGVGAETMRTTLRKAGVRRREPWERV
jgi:lambda repressor-like predicted transcriptional regulator